MNKSKDSEIEVIFNDIDEGNNQYKLLIPKVFRMNMVLPNCTKEKSNSILSKLPSILQDKIILVDTILKTDSLTIIYCDKELVLKIYLSLLIHLPNLRIKDCIFIDSDKFIVTNSLDDNIINFEYAHIGPEGEKDYPHSFILSDLDDDDIENLRNEFDENNDYIRIVKPDINLESDDDFDFDLRFNY